MRRWRRRRRIARAKGGSRGAERSEKETGEEREAARETHAANNGSACMDFLSPPLALAVPLLLPPCAWVPLPLLRTHVHGTWFLSFSPSPSYSLFSVLRPLALSPRPLFVPHATVISTVVDAQQPDARARERERV